MKRRRTTTILLCACGLVVALSASALAGAERREKPKPQTKPVQTLGRWAVKRLGRAREGLEKGQLASALSALDELRDRGDRLNAHERAMMWQTYGYVQSAQEQYAAAAGSFEKCLAAGGLSEQATENARYNLAQLYLMLGNNDGAIEHFRIWFETAENPRPEAYFMFALAYQRAERPREALVQAKQAAAKAEAPKESWLQLLLSLHFELEQYREAVPVLQALIDRYPQKVYWQQLASAYSELGDHRRALGVMELAYEQGVLTEHRELVNLAQLYLYQGIPYEAAQVLERGMGSGAIEKNADTWKLLADSLLQARERERGVEPLQRAAELADDGNLYVRLAQLAIDAERWGAARSALEAAIEKGGLKRAGNVYLLLGVVNVREGRDAAARKAFAAAQKYEKTRTSAREWLESLDQEQELALQTARSEEGLSLPAR